MNASSTCSRTYSAGRPRWPARPVTKQAAVLADAGHGPGVTVGHFKVAVVASGGDPITETDPLSTTRDGLTRLLTRLITGVYVNAMAAVADGGVERTDVVPGVGDDELVTVEGANGG